MASVNVYQVKFQIVLPTGKAGPAYMYRRETRTALVQATSVHPKDLLATVTNNVTLVGSEAIEILSVSLVAGGTEGAANVWT